MDGTTRTMATSTLLGGVILTVFIILEISGIAETFQCYSCSYVFSGHDGRTHYACVNDTSSFIQTRKIDCQLPKKCVTKTVYETDYARLLSSNRNCQVPEKPSGCDTPNEVRPTCFQNCVTDLCNDIDGDMKPALSDAVSVTTIHFNALSITMALSLVVFCKFALS